MGGLFPTGGSQITLQNNHDYTLSVGIKTMVATPTLINKYIHKQTNTYINKYVAFFGPTFLLCYM